MPVKVRHTEEWGGGVGRRSGAEEWGGGVGRMKDADEQGVGVRQQ